MGEAEQGKEKQHPAYAWRFTYGILFKFHSHPMLSPSPYFINEATEAEMLIILLKVSLWESNLAKVQYQILWPSKLLNFREEDYPHGYMTVYPGSWDRNVLDGHNWWGIIRGITVSPLWTEVSALIGGVLSQITNNASG